MTLYTLETVMEATRWIPVSERLPEESDLVLVATQYEQEVWGSWNGMHVASLRDGKWREEVESNVVAVVTHWMPLPPHPAE
jgi:hypothetical protein